jgi:hypothetical protein
MGVELEHAPTHRRFPWEDSILPGATAKVSTLLAICDKLLGNVTVLGAGEWGLDLVESPFRAQQ